MKISYYFHKAHLIAKSTTRESDNYKTKFSAALKTVYKEHEKDKNHSEIKHVNKALRNH